MGVKLAVSKSQDNLKYKFTQPTFFPSDIKIDELTPKSTPKSSKKVAMKEIFADISGSEDKAKPNQYINSIQSSEESSIDFTEEELKRFRKTANYELQFNDLNRNMTTLSQDFIKQQRKCYIDESEKGTPTEFCDSPDKIRDNKMIVPQKQTYMLDQVKAPSARTPPHIEAVVVAQLNLLIWQVSCQLMLKPEVSNRIVDKPGMIKPQLITMEQRMQFIEILKQNMPEKDGLLKKLNQNITPLPCQILKCMRLDFSEEPEDVEEDNYEQVNRYEFVISQESCAKSVMQFKNSLDKKDELRQMEEIKRNNDLLQEFQKNCGESPFFQKVQRFINQRQIFLKNKKNHTRELRWEVLNIQLHCIFDSWNQEIIQICSARPGFSGIGLNELTLSMINHNRKVPDQKCLTIIGEAKEKLVEILVDDMDISAKILRQNFHEMCETDSAWIFYADQALSYALQLVYLVQQQICTQLAKQIRKISIKNSLLP